MQYKKGDEVVLNLTKEKGKELGYHRNTVADLIKRGAVVISDKIYAPIVKRKARVFKNKGTKAEFCKVVSND